MAPFILSGQLRPFVDSGFEGKQLIMNDELIKNRLAFLERAEGLKNAVRSAHSSGGRPESAAEHSWRLALMAMIFADEFAGLDLTRILKLCLVHDLGEAIHGDIPANLQTPDDGRAEAEREDLLDLVSGLDSGPRREIIELWEEYEGAASPEARLVKGLDKLETLIQHNQGLNPPDFDYSFNLGYGQDRMDGHPLLPRIRRLVDELTARHDAESRRP